MKNCSEFFSHLNICCTKIRNKFNATTKTFKSNDTKEYLSSSFQNSVTQHEIIHELSMQTHNLKVVLRKGKINISLRLLKLLLFQMLMPKSCGLMLYQKLVF